MRQEIPPVHNPIFPTHESLHDVIMEASYALEDGVLSTNSLRQLFGSYHNTLIAAMQNQASSQSPSGE